MDRSEVPSWICREDGAALQFREDRFVCGECGRGPSALDGVPIFAAAPERPALEAQVPLLDEFRARMEGRSVGEAEADLCAAGRCAPRRFGLDEAFFSSVGPGETALAFEAGIGDTTLRLADCGARVVACVPTLGHLEVLARRIRQAGRGDVRLALLRDGSRLPLADGTLTAIVADGIAGPVFGARRGRFAGLVSEWARVLRPEGRLALGLHRARAPGSAASLDRRVALATRGRSRPLPRRREVMQALAAAGFAEASVLSPLSSARQASVVLPLERPQVARYLLRRLLRRNSLPLRMAQDFAAALAGLAPLLGPDRYVLARRGAVG